MKINNFGRVGMNPYAKQIEKMDKAATIAKKDKIEISTEALELQKGNSIEAKREERVQQLKEQVQNGEYKVNSRNVAEKLYSFWNEKY